MVNFSDSISTNLYECEGQNILLRLSLRVFKTHKSNLEVSFSNKAIFLKQKQRAKMLWQQMQNYLKAYLTACILSIVKQITSPGWVHETSARAWCTGKTQRNRVEREVGGGIGMGNTCNSMADSCQCMTKLTEMLWSN